jgi:HK97 family phage prohead protease
MTQNNKTRRRLPDANAGARSPFQPGANLVRLASEDISARFAASTYNPKTRTVTAVLSVGSRVPRFGVFEELSIAPDAIDLRRVALGQVRLLDSHNRSSVEAILGVIADAWIESGKLLGRIQFSETDAGRSAEGMVARGEVSAISIGYSVRVWTQTGIEDGAEIWRADKWELLEASLVSVPADADALIRSAPTTLQTSLKGNRMDPEVTHNSNNETTEPGGQSPQRGGSRPVMSDREVREAYDMAERAGIGLDFVRQHVSAGGSMEDFRNRVFERLAGDANRTRTNPARPNRDETFDNPDFLSRSISDALYAKMTGKAPTGAAVELVGRSMLDMGAMILQASGERVSWADRTRLADRILTRGHTTSDFPYLLSSAGNRVLADAYQIAQTPLKTLARRRTVTDFRPVSILRLSEAPRLDKVLQNGEIKHGSRAEAKEGFAVETYAKIFSISRNAIINDDLGAFADASAAFGRSAASTEADLLAGLLLANSGDGAKLNDGNPLYGVARGNKAAAGSALTSDAVADGRKALRNVFDIDGKTPLNVVPRHLVVGSAMETDADRVVAIINPTSEVDVNPFGGKLTVQVEPRLTGNAWRLFADPSQLAAIVIAYLAGREGPQIDLKEGWDVLGVEFRAVLDVGCAVQDWRGTYLNSGAA